MANPIDQPELLARFPAADFEIKRFKSYNLESDYTVSTDGWELGVYEEDAKRIARLRDLELQPIEILIDGAQQLLGRVDITDIGGDGSAVTLQGRDYIADIVECNVDPALKFKEQMTLGDALKLALSPCGITTVADPDDIAIQNVRSGKKLKGGKSGKSFKTIKLEDFKPEAGTGLFDICNRLVARHGATIQPSNKRNTIIVDAPDYKTTPVATLRRTKDQNLSGAINIITSSARRDYSHMPTAALFTSKNGRSGEAGAGLNLALDFRTLANAFGGELKAKLPRIAAGTGKEARRKPGAAPLPDGLLYRFLYARDDESRNADQLFAAAKRSVAQRLKDTLVYRCKVRGHRDEKGGGVWAVNTIVQIEDDVCNVHEPLWVHSRRFSNSPSEGATTELICWRPEAFQIGE